MLISTVLWTAPACMGTEFYACCLKFDPWVSIAFSVEVSNYQKKKY